jgi:hypothetical protein
MGLLNGIAAAISATRIAPPAPTGLVATEINDGQINLTWDSISGVDFYRIYYGTDGLTFASTTISETNSKSITSLIDGTIYYFFVTATWGSKEGQASPVVSCCTIPSKFLTANVKAWYDFTDASLKTVSSGRVIQINDKSGNGYHLIAPNEAKRPYDLGINGIQGQGGQFASAGVTLPMGSYTSFLVGRIDTFETAKILLQNVISTNLSGEIHRIAQSGWNPIYAEVPADGIWFLVSSVVSATITDILQINNGTAISLPNNSNQTPILCVLGNANFTGYLYGALKMAIIIDESLAPTDVAKAKTYLNWKYEVFF